MTRARVPDLPDQRIIQESHSERSTDMLVKESHPINDDEQFPDITILKTSEYTSSGAAAGVDIINPSRKKDDTSG